MDAEYTVYLELLAKARSHKFYKKRPSRLKTRSKKDLRRLMARTSDEEIPDRFIVEYLGYLVYNRYVKLSNVITLEELWKGYGCQFAEESPDEEAEAPPPVVDDVPPEIPAPQQDFRQSEEFQSLVEDWSKRFKAARRAARAKAADPSDVQSDTSDEAEAQPAAESPIPNPAETEAFNKMWAKRLKKVLGGASDGSDDEEGEEEEEDEPEEAQPSSSSSAPPVVITAVEPVTVDLSNDNEEEEEARPPPPKLLKSNFSWLKWTKKK